MQSCGMANLTFDFKREMSSRVNNMYLGTYSRRLTGRCNKINHRIWNFAVEQLEYLVSTNHYTSKIVLACLNGACDRVEHHFYVGLQRELQLLLVIGQELPRHAIMRVMWIYWIVLALFFNFIILIYETKSCHHIFSVIYYIRRDTCMLLKYIRSQGHHVYKYGDVSHERCG